MILIFKFSHIISGLLPSNHRVEMVQKAIENYDFVKISTWEAEQKKWNRTRAVLDEHMRQIAETINNAEALKPDWLPDSDLIEPPKIFLLCGGDLLESFSVPGLWQTEDVSTRV